jgi:hypothetical protein
MTTMENFPPAGSNATIKALASAYAERLSCLRCGASDVELAENRLMIDLLERQYQDRRGAVGLHLVDPR